MGSWPTGGITMNLLFLACDPLAAVFAGTLAQQLTTIEYIGGRGWTMIAPLRSGLVLWLTENSVYATFFKPYPPGPVDYRAEFDTAFSESVAICCTLRARFPVLCAKCPRVFLGDHTPLQTGFRDVSIDTNGIPPRLMYYELGISKRGDIVVRGYLIKPRINMLKPGVVAAMMVRPVHTIHREKIKRRRTK